MREEGRALIEYLKQNFPGATNHEVKVQGCWNEIGLDVYIWEVYVHYNDHSNPATQDIRLVEKDLEVIKIKLEAEIASRKILARLNTTRPVLGDE